MKKTARMMGLPAYLRSLRRGLWMGALLCAAMASFGDAGHCLLMGRTTM